MKVIAIVGMSGSGKSEVTAVFERRGFERIRFGDVTDKEVQRRGLPLTEENERRVREALRQELGMAAYAKLNRQGIDEVLRSANVVVDGLYSWQEYRLLKEHYGESMVVVAVYSSPKTRQARLAQRKVRPLTREESLSRDYAEIENLEKGGPIAMADFTLINEGPIEELTAETERILDTLL